MLAIGGIVTSSIKRRILAEGADIGDQVVAMLISRNGGPKFGLLALIRVFSIGLRRGQFVHLSDCLENVR